MAKNFNFVLFVILIYNIHGNDGVTTYTIDDSVGHGRTFTGIGAISGGGATSKLLVNYPDRQRSEILDYLFKPNFGASLDIFKVEIGGDMQSTDGTEASHMHYSWDEDYTRGYEWWMLKEAKKRNPHIKLYGLPWGFPGWLSDSHGLPWKNMETTADYIVKWVHGAKVHHNLNIDYIGIWNESPYRTSYIKTLRKSLDKAGYKHTLIVAPDEFHWGIADQMAKDKELENAVYAIGSHYPKTVSTHSAQQTGKSLWSSEDTVWGQNTAEKLNQNYINGYMTTTIFWNIITSYYPGLHDYNAGLMSAVEPWSGHYQVKLPIWELAHTTQFTDIGWKYLKHGHGVGKFNNGGTYVALTSPDGKQLTIVIETMTSPEHGSRLAEQPVKFEIKGNIAKSVHSLNVWHTDTKHSSKYFQKYDAIKVVDGSFSLTLRENEVWTLTTVTTGHKGDYSNIPDSKPFPLPYTENFEGYQVGQEPYNFAQQIGSFEVEESGGHKYMKQVLIDVPVHWYYCHVDSYKTSFNIFGDHNWKDIAATVSVQIKGHNISDGVFLAVRSSMSGCKTRDQIKGLFMFYFPKERTYTLSTDLYRTKVLASGKVNKVTNSWDVLHLQVQGTRVVGSVNGEILFDKTAPKEIAHGWVAVGTYPFGIAWFDNFKVEKVSSSIIGR
ncbi:hypothetical protein SNE40_012006 [Patella caerulea]|uniref:galactosylceramidase n=1 Tax=Patella caerulea TaxID=87958 RepID=A0AAN8JKQ0_PATCE